MQTHANVQRILHYFFCEAFYIALPRRGAQDVCKTSPVIIQMARSLIDILHEATY